MAFGRQDDRVRFGGVNRAPHSTWFGTGGSCRSIESQETKVVVSKAERFIRHPRELETRRYCAAVFQTLREGTALCAQGEGRRPNVKASPESPLASGRRDEVGPLRNAFF